MLTCSLLSIASCFFSSLIPLCFHFSSYFSTSVEDIFACETILHAKNLSLIFEAFSPIIPHHAIIQALGREVWKLYCKINRIGDENDKWIKLGLRNKRRNQYPTKQTWMEIYFNNIVWTAPFSISSTGFIFKIFE